MRLIPDRPGPSIAAAGEKALWLFELEGPGKKK
jgi:hypothetical protein